MLYIVYYNRKMVVMVKIDIYLLYNAVLLTFCFVSHMIFNVFKNLRKRFPNNFLIYYDYFSFLACTGCEEAGDQMYTYSQWIS